MKAGTKTEIIVVDKNQSRTSIIGYLTNDVGGNTARVSIEWEEGGVLYKAVIPRELIIRMAESNRIVGKLY